MSEHHLNQNPKNYNPSNHPAKEKLGHASSLQGGKEENNREGDFVMVTREIIRALSDRRIVKLTTDEKSICLILLEQTIGQHCEIRGVTIQKFIDMSGIPRRTVFLALSSLVNKGIVKRERIKGIREVQYGLNPEFFGRIYPGRIENVYYLDKTKVLQESPSRCSTTHLKGEHPITFKVPKPAPRANPGVANIFSNISSNISLRELRELLNSKSLNTKKRWTELVQNIIAKHPEDQSLLLLAIQKIEREGKDLMGVPIRASILGLFEKTEWTIMRAALLAILEQDKEKREQESRRVEREKMVSAARERILDESPPVDVSKLLPMFQRYAEKGTEGTSH